MPADANLGIFACEIGVVLLAFHIGVEVYDTIVCQDLFGEVDAGIWNCCASFAARSLPVSVGREFADIVVKESKIPVDGCLSRCNGW